MKVLGDKGIHHDARTLGTLLGRGGGIGGGAGHDPVSIGTDAAVLLNIGAADEPQEINFETVSANYVLSGPTSGGAAVPTFRVMVAADLPEVPLTGLGSYARGSVIRGGASDWEAHDAKGDGYILVGDGTDVASVVVSGDVTLSNAGATEVTAIRGYAVQDHAPLDGEVLAWVAGNSRYEPTATAVVPAPSGQNQLLLANATPAWATLAAPTAQYQRLSTGASPYTPAWTTDLGMADDAYVGIPSGGRLIFDSTPATDLIRVASGSLDLDGNDLIVDADGDTYITSPLDDVVDIMIAGSLGFRFSPDVLHVYSATGGIQMDDTNWIGLSQATGRMQWLDSTPDQIKIFDAELVLSLPTDTVAFVDAGYTDATEDSWIEVDLVGGGQGYIHVFAAK